MRSDSSSWRNAAGHARERSKRGSADVTNIWTLGVTVLSIQLPGKVKRERQLSERKQKPNFIVSLCFVVNREHG